MFLYLKYLPSSQVVQKAAMDVINCPFNRIDRVPFDLHRAGPMLVDVLAPLRDFAKRVAWLTQDRSRTYLRGWL